MKIVFVGGGTSGHFYPLMAVAEKVNKKSIENKLVQPSLHYFGESIFNEKMLRDRGINYSWIPSGKNRLYFSVHNFFDYFKILAGVIIAFLKLLFLYPDVIFSKGGYDSLPTCLAAFILRIPIIMHDSDALPGRASLLISKFAYRIALSYKEAIPHFNNRDNSKNINNIAVTGQPILEKYLPDNNFKRVYNEGRKNILITGGSSGSVKINDTILEILPELCSKYNVIHQVGVNNIEDIKIRSSVILESYNKNAYAPYASIDFSKIYSQVDMAISRAGSSMFELLAWQIPSIIIPISPEVSRDQAINAEIMQKNKLFKVIREENLSPHLLLNEIIRVLDSRSSYEATLPLNNTETKSQETAADIIADELLDILKTHK